MPEPNSKEFKFQVDSQLTGKRLDLFLKEVLPESFSRTAIKHLIENGNVFLDNQIFKVSHHKIKSGQTISVTVPPKKEFSLSAEEIPLDILHEDEDLIVLNKPAGLVVHPGEGNQTHTLVNALLYHTKELSTVNAPERPGIVHRLDKETSGVMVVAKNNQTHLALARQFAKHSIKKVYVALAEGSVEFQEGDIELPLSRSTKDRKKIAVRFIDGKPAKTYYRVLKRFKDRTLLELVPYTGRTHQLRVHLAHIGHSILGDEKYGKKSSFPRLALHAQTLGFIHPRTKEYVEFSQPAPQEFLTEKSSK